MGKKSCRPGSQAKREGAPPHQKLLVVGRRRFSSLAAVARAFKIRPSQLYQRLDRGMSLDAAIASGSKNLQHRPVQVMTLNGPKVFPTLEAACRQYQVARSLFSVRLGAGWSIEEALGLVRRFLPGRPLAIDLTHAGKRYQYRSHGEAERSHGIGRGLVWYRLQNGWTIAQALELAPPPSDSKIDACGYVYVITHKDTGMRYVGQTMLPVEKRWQEHLDTAFKRRTGHNRPLYEAIKTFGLKAFVIKQVAVAKTRPELDKLERAWIRRLGSVTPTGFNQQRGGAGASWGHSVIVDGVKYASITAAARAFGERPGNVHSRLKRGWRLEEAIGFSKRPKSWNAPRKCRVRVDGKVHVFPTQAEAARAFGVWPSVLSLRLKAGWSMSKALRRLRKGRGSE